MQTPDRIKAILQQAEERTAEPTSAVSALLCVAAPQPS